MERFKGSIHQIVIFMDSPSGLHTPPNPPPDTPVNHLNGEERVSLGHSRPKETRTERESCWVDCRPLNRQPTQLVAVHSIGRRGISKRGEEGDAT